MELKQNNSANIAELIEHSHTMLRHAEAGEWDTVVNDEVIRRQLINTFFQNLQMSQMSLISVLQFRNC